MAPQKIVYISCNPETQARDVAQLVQKGYRAEYFVPVDLFPHTEHIECVARMTKVKG
jgi:23S rRNA (uracil1939-C5)-methyltransferase